MINETRKIFENIKNVRHLLTEGAGHDVITKAIQNHEWIRIYYNAENEEGKNATGYRTIRPYVLGTKGGKQMLRAWQDSPKNSWHFDNRKTRPDSNQHDYWTDSEGVKPGWRMFRVDKITSVYPTGRKFNDKNGLPMIPAGYHEGGDDDMDSVEVYVSTKTEPDFDYKYDKDIEVQATTPNDMRARWDSIRRGNKNSKKITSDDVNKLRTYASRVLKKSHANFLVAIDDKGDFQLLTPKQRDRENIPDVAIVGTLPHLYDTLVKQNAPTNNKFFDDIKNKTQNDLKLKSHKTQNQEHMDVSENNLTSIPYNKTTFFK